MEHDERPVLKPGTLVRLKEYVARDYAELGGVPAETYLGKVYPITTVFTHYTKTHDEVNGGSPGFDETVGYWYLVTLEGFPTMVHDLEFDVIDEQGAPS